MASPVINTTTDAINRTLARLVEALEEMDENAERRHLELMTTLKRLLTAEEPPPTETKDTR